MAKDRFPSPLAALFAPAEVNRGGAGGLLSLPRRVIDGTRSRLQETRAKFARPSAAQRVEAHDAHGFTVSFARTPAEVREAQRLRYKVFAEEMGAGLAHVVDEEGRRIDQDMFDRHCDHLIVRDNKTLQVIGTYRILAPHAAKKIGCYYSESEFFLTRLAHLRHNMVELGRSCVHQDYRSGAVIMLLWKGIAEYMRAGGYEHLIGCASISMRDGGHQAASLYRALEGKHLAPAEYQIFPRLALPIEKLDTSLEVEAPPLVKGYLRVGAMICGAPAWDPDFNSADFLMLLSLSRMNPRYRKHFFGE